MRATTVLGLLSRLKVQRTTVSGFELNEAAGSLVLDVKPTTHRGRCGVCERVATGYDQRQRVWRHTDLGEMRIELRATLRRIDCPEHGPTTEWVPWAEHGAWHTIDFEDLAGYCAQQMSATQVVGLMRMSWRTVGSIVRRVIGRKMPGDRLDGLRRIGIDELSYRKHHEYVTVVVDHDRQCVVWTAPGKNAETVAKFFTALGPERTAQLELVSMDMSAAYISAVKAGAPHVRIVFDRFHVQRLAHDALDDVRRTLTRELRAAGDPNALKGMRFALHKRPWNLSLDEKARLVDSIADNRSLYRAYLLKETLALILDSTDASTAAKSIAEWCDWTARSRLPPFVRVGKTIRKHAASILAYITTRLNNGRTEGLNGKIRVITRRAFGFHCVSSLIAYITLCCGGLTLTPRHR